MRNDLPKAITAEDVIRRYDLNSLVQNRKEIQINKLGLDKTENILYKFIDSTLKGMTDTEDQVDGKITTWFFDTVPTLLNEPASNWTDDKTKNSHIGDLYYDRTNGNTYIFNLSEDEYSWNLVDDNNINEAMALANSNPDTSDGFRNIFVIDPIAPYKVGDIWIKSNGDVYRCNVARESGNLNEAEWVKSSEYSNDNYAYDARAIIDQFTEFITASYVCKVLVKTTKDSIELSVSSATTKITNDYTTAISESEGRAEIREGQVLLSANRYTSGEIARVEGEIGDIADITQTEESEYAGVNFTNVPQSEPININIHPIIDNISYLYPNSSLFPSSTTYLKTRTLRFTNTTDFEITEDTYYNNYRKYYSFDGSSYTLLVAGTDYTIGNAITGTVYQNTYIDYELPDDLLYYDSDNYDLLEMDYGNQLCRVTKKCKYNADGTVSLLNEPTITNYEYPSIPLELGNYEIQLLGYTSGYIFVRLMSNNVYTGQFITKAKLDASVNILPHTIELITAELVSGTQCGITIKLRDANGNELDSKEANITMTGKVAFDDLSTSGRTTINGSNITTGTIDASVVNVNNINASNIKTGTLKSSNYVSGTSGTSINLSTGAIDSKNFKVSSTGTVTATNANISGTITATAGTIGGCSISSGTLQIGNANITSISANKITTGTLNGSNVNVTNINASNITGGTLNVDRISANSITTNKLQDNSVTNSKIANTTITSGKMNISQLSSITANMGTITAGQISNNRAKLNLSNGYLQMWPSDGGSLIFNGAARMSAVYGVGISSNSNGTVGAPSNNGIDIKGCSYASVYIGTMSNASGTSEVASVTVFNNGVALRGSRLTANGATIATTSSKATKKNIKKLTNKQKNEVYELIKNIPTISYDYKKKYGDKGYYGFLIEDIENTKLNTLLHITQNEYDKKMKLYSTEDLSRLELIVIQQLMNKVDELERRLVHE